MNLDSFVPELSVTFNISDFLISISGVSGGSRKDTTTDCLVSVVVVAELGIPGHDSSRAEIAAFQDKTDYHLLTQDYIKISEFDGKEIIKV